MFCPRNANFHVQLRVRLSFYLFYVQLHQVAFVVFQCSHPSRRNACKCKAKQLYQWNEQNHRNYIKHTHFFFFMWGTVLLLNTKKHFLDFIELAILSRMRWVEISSSLISRSAFEENQGKSHSSGQKQAISDSWGPTEEIWEHTFFLESVWLKLPSWSKKPDKHTYNLSNVRVPCRKACQDFHP